ncbi:MAG: hypothetical protein KJI72_03140 [Patescibacteria group bacterium]|nr:hypothetical protein [Patescibacteria group bacterium]
MKTRDFVGIIGIVAVIVVIVGLLQKVQLLNQTVQSSQQRIENLEEQITGLQSQLGNLKNGETLFSKKFNKTVSNEPLKLPPYSILPKPNYDLQDLALGIHKLINLKRNEAGLAPIVWDDKLAELASDHSRDQTKDNIELTNPDLLCHYPLIRHESFSLGFYPKDRLENRGITYRASGENLAVVSFVKNAIYRYPDDTPPLICPVIEKFEFSEGSQEERVQLYQEILNESLETVRTLSAVEWVNKEWFSSDEIEERIVEGWMESSGHRQNILNPEFNFGGVGVMEINEFMIITHDFVGK